MRRALAWCLVAGLLAGCVAETVERRRPRRGPVKEVGYVDYGGGQVRYSAVGWGWAVASRRKLAFKLMRGNCGPELEPRILDEYSRQDADASYNGVDIDASMAIGDQHYVIERYVHIAYECVARGTREASASTTTARAPLLVVPPVSVSTMTRPSPEPPK